MEKTPKDPDFDEEETGLSFEEYDEDFDFLDEDEELDEDFDEEDEEEEEIEFEEEEEEKAELEEEQEREEGESEEKEEKELPSEEAEKAEAEEAVRAKPAPPVEKLISYGEIPVNLSVVVETLQLPLQKLLELSQGNFLELQVQPQDAVDLVVEGRCIGKGEWIQIGDRLGIRILELGGRESDRTGS